MSAYLTVINKINKLIAINKHCTSVKAALQELVDEHTDGGPECRLLMKHLNDLWREHGKPDALSVGGQCSPGTRFGKAYITSKPLNEKDELLLKVMDRGILDARTARFDKDKK